jgi:hypothetical protein
VQGLNPARDYAEGGARRGRCVREKSSRPEIGGAGNRTILDAILSTVIRDCTRHGFIPSPIRHLNGAANLDVWLADISRTAMLVDGPF